ncbi:hypothetical protein AX16_002306 [Volvariella volvacea WC 439]|nr:hypothetical protein AX16_002306 [Volvariella volvacea WC 439]
MPNEHGNEKGTSSREVTDPITHLPITITDHTSIELERVFPSSVAGAEGSPEETRDEQEQSQKRHDSLDRLLQDETRRRRWYSPVEFESKFKTNSALAAGLGAGLGAIGSLLFLAIIGKTAGFVSVVCALLNCIALAFITTAGVARYWDDYLKDYLHSSRDLESNSAPILDEPPPQRRPSRNDGDDIESALWLNSLLSSVWPIVNPSLFTSLADTLEDTLQGTLPKFIRGVRVADIGQGSEPLRVVGIRYLDPGEAAKDKGTLKAEEGDFINMEVAVAYRAKLSPASALKDRSGNAHLLMQFWLSGGIVLPVWVELEGFLANARMRVQLTPNPPFFSLLTLTLLGQPKVSLTCTPLAKNFLNVMDVPGLSTWLQDSIDSSVREYVAPGSLTLDLKTIFLGRPKLDTETVGVVIVTLKRAAYSGGESGSASYNFRKDKLHDGYLTVSWSKWGKPLWSTRVIEGCEDPVWEETTAFLVGPGEFNAEESLRLQLWDSDRFTADDHLGTIDVPLSDLVTSPKTLNRIEFREDFFTNGTTGAWPGTLSWECGYFEKTTMRHHMPDDEDHVNEIEREVEEEAEKKFREAQGKEGHDELRQQKKEDLEDRQNEIISGMRPSDEWPSGILSIHIEQISGLKVQNIRRTGVDETEDEESEDLPSAYCTVLLNHQRVYKTRTKMKSNNPFFNASTERFIRDWRTTVLIIAIRDYRLHENDPLLGVILLPLPDLLRDRSQVTQSYPMVGGIGYGRLQLSLTFRSVQASLPRNLLGWDVGTLEVSPDIRIPMDLPADLASCRLTFRSSCGKGKLKPFHDGYWRHRHEGPLHLAVTQRYRSNIIVEFRKHALGPDKILAFCVLWLKDIPDNEPVTRSLAVWKDVDSALVRAQKNADSDEEMLRHGVEKVSAIEVTFQFWPGMSGFHQQATGSDPNMTDIMEVLDCVEETKELSKGLLYGSEGGSNVTHSIFEESSESESESESTVSGADGEKGLVNKMKDWKGKQQKLHRKHRGLMQWSITRNLVWIGHGMEHQVGKLGGKVKGLVKHQDKDTGIDTEV